jgi:methyltransferase (TIGR00027 family)
MTDQSGEFLPGVSRTAVWMASMRASEGARADRLFDDSLAMAFASAAAGGDRSGASGAVPFAPGASDFIAIRTRFYDDQVVAAGTAGIRQVVALAAGLDSRAFRLDWPDGVRLFELDLPELFAFKEPVVAASGASPRCDRVTVPVDLRADWPAALAVAGFDPTVPTSWLAEGLLPYLTRPDNNRLLTALTNLSRPGSHFAFDHLDGAAAERPAMRETAEAIRRTGAQLNSTMDSPAAWLAEYGWRASETRIPDLAKIYGRPLPEDRDVTTSNAIILTAGVLT